MTTPDPVALPTLAERAEQLRYIARHGLHSKEDWHELLNLLIAAHTAQAVAEREAIIEDIALVTAYDKPLPGSLAGHVKGLVSDLLKDRAHQAEEIVRAETRLRDKDEEIARLREHLAEAYREWDRS